MRSTLIGRTIGYADLARHARKARSADQAVRENARIHLAARMGKLRGLPQKIGQIFSMADDADRAAAFAPLTDCAEPLPFENIEAELEAAWGRPIRKVVRSIEPHGLAASLGQVHKAVLTGGRHVAIKVRYPGIRRAVMNDLKMLGWMSAPVGDLRRGFDLASYRAEILRDLEDELDYRVEARNQRQMRADLGRLPGWIVPTVIDELSCENVLVSEWVDGERIDEAARWRAPERANLASRLIDGFFASLFEYGRLHADPHPGNYRFRLAPNDSRIILYDYGSVASIARHHRIALLKLIEITTGASGDPYKPLIALGFDERLLAPIRPKLAALCMTLFEPFRSPGKYDLAGWRRTERSEQILGDDRWNFRFSGPAHLIFILRAFKGLTYYLQKLGSDVSWSIAVRPHLDRHRAELAAFDAAAAASEPGTFGAVARHLRIRVTQDGRQKVALTFLGAAVDNLDEIMDDDLRRRLEVQGIDIADIIRRVRQTAYVPQDLFHLPESPGRKGVRVWLE